MTLAAAVHAECCDAAIPFADHGHKSSRCRKAARLAVTEVADHLQNYRAEFFRVDLDFVTNRAALIKSVRALNRE